MDKYPYREVYEVHNEQDLDRAMFIRDRKIMLRQSIWERIKHSKLCSVGFVTVPDLHKVSLYNLQAANNALNKLHNHATWDNPVMRDQVAREVLIGRRLLKGTSIPKHRNE